VAFETDTKQVMFYGNDMVDGVKGVGVDVRVD
jgi:hypothetical protein